LREQLRAIAQRARPLREQPGEIAQRVARPVWPQACGPCGPANLAIGVLSALPRWRRHRRLRSPARPSFRWRRRATPRPRACSKLPDIEGKRSWPFQCSVETIRMGDLFHHTTVAAQGRRPHSQTSRTLDDKSSWRPSAPAGIPGANGIDIPMQLTNLPCASLIYIKVWSGTLPYRLGTTHHMDASFMLHGKSSEHQFSRRGKANTIRVYCVGTPGRPSTRFLSGWCLSGFGRGWPPSERVAGVSIGAVNPSLIAENPTNRRGRRERISVSARSTSQLSSV